MLKLRPTCEEMLRETKTRRLRILPGRERRTQQGMLLDDLDFDDFDLDQYNIRNPNKATQTDIFADNKNSNYSSVAPSQSINTPSEIERNEQQQRQTSTSTGESLDDVRYRTRMPGESLDDVRYRTRMSIADDLATVARVGGNVIYYTGQGIGQGISAVIDAYNWINEDNDEDEQPEAPIDEEVYEQTQGLMRRGASRSRSQSSRASGEATRLAREASDEASQTPEERASSSNQAMRLIRRGASRSRSETPPKKNNIGNINDNRSYY